MALMGKPQGGNSVSEAADFFDLVRNAAEYEARLLQLAARLKEIEEAEKQLSIKQEAREAFDMANADRAEAKAVLAGAKTKAKELVEEAKKDAEAMLSLANKEVETLNETKKKLTLDLDAAKAKLDAFNKEMEVRAETLKKAELEVQKAQNEALEMTAKYQKKIEQLNLVING